MNSASLAALGMLIIFAGFLAVIIGVILGAGGPSSIGGFILIGPIPIVFGSGPNSSMLASVALAISAVVVASYLVSFFMRGLGRRSEAEVGPEAE
jgi:uncharacterized membrane protein